MERMREKKLGCAISLTAALLPAKPFANSADVKHYKIQTDKAKRTDRQTYRQINKWID